MRLHVIGSSSKGNGYVLESGKEALVIEMGFPLSEVKKALSFNMSMVKGCLVSHRHGDHAKYVQLAVEAGIHTIAPQDVFNGIQISVYSHFCHAAKAMKGYWVGGFRVLPLSMHHDVPCFGYVVSHEDFGKLLFATDTETIDYNVEGLNCIMVEANYDADTLATNVENGTTNAIVANRTRRTHMCIDTTIDFLKRTDLAKVSKIVLMHLSENNSREDFKDRVQAQTGIPTIVASQNMTIEL